MKKLLRTALAAWAAVILLPACTVPSSYDPAVPHAVTPAVSADTPTDADPSAPKYVALTFDDGPSPRCTPRLLDGLAEYGARATFFVVGCQTVKDPDIVRRIAAEGHQVGNHSYDHPQMDSLTCAQALGRPAKKRRPAAPAAGEGGLLGAPALRPVYRPGGGRPIRAAGELVGGHRGLEEQGCR